MGPEGMSPEDTQTACDNFVQRIKKRLDAATEEKAQRIGEELEEQAKLLEKYPDQYESVASITTNQSKLICKVILEPRKDLDKLIQDIVKEDPQETLLALDELSELLTDCLHIIIACFKRVAHKKLSRHDFIFFKVLFPHLKQGTDMVRPLEEEVNNPESQETENNPETQDSPRTMRSESQEQRG